MTRYHVRTLCSGDFEALRQLEADVFGAAGDDVLCPHYLRLCIELYGDTCFLALVDNHPVRYLLFLVRDREAYCTTLAVRTEFQHTRVTPLLLASEVGTVRDFCGPDDERNVSKIDRTSFELLRSRYERLGLLPKQAVAA